MGIGDTFIYNEHSEFWGWGSFSQCSSFLCIDANKLNVGGIVAPCLHSPPPEYNLVPDSKGWDGGEKCSRGEIKRFPWKAGAGAGAGVLMLVHAASQLLIVVEENYLYWCFVWAENAQELRNGTNTRFILFCSRVSSIGVPQNNLILWNVLGIFCIFSHILQASQKALLVYCTFLV